MLKNSNNIMKLHSVNGIKKLLFHALIAKEHFFQIDWRYICGHASRGNLWRCAVGSKIHHRMKRLKESMHLWDRRQKIKLLSKRVGWITVERLLLVPHMIRYSTVKNKVATRGGKDKVMKESNVSTAGRGLQSIGLRYIRHHAETRKILINNNIIHKTM